MHRGHSPAHPISIIYALYARLELSGLRTAVVSATETHRAGRPLVPPGQLETDAIKYLLGCMTGDAQLSMVVCLSPASQNGWETWRVARAAVLLAECSAC